MQIREVVSTVLSLNQTWLGSPNFPTTLILYQLSLTENRTLFVMDTFYEFLFMPLRLAKHPCC